MSKKPSNTLFNLIRSLDGSEKRYFRLFALRNGGGKEKIYLELFDRINSQEKYDEPQIRKHFQTKHRIRQFAASKNSLQTILLRSLRAYHGESGAEDQIFALIQETRILFGKSLYDLALQKLLKAKKIAQLNEEFFLQLKISTIVNTILSFKLHGGKVPDSLDLVLMRDHEILEKADLFIDLDNLHTQIYYLAKRTIFIRNKAEKMQYDQIISHPSMQKVRNIISFEAQYLYHSILSYYHYAHSDFRKCYNDYKTLLALIESKPFKKKRNQPRLISVLYNLILTSIFLKRHNQAWAYLHKLKQVRPDNMHGRIMLSTQVHILDLALHIKTGKFHRAFTHLNSIIEHLDKYHHSIDTNYRATIWFSLAHAYFGAGEYKKALTWINKILYEPDRDTIENLYSAAKIVSIVIYYELGYIDLLESTIRSYNRYLLRKNRLYRAEQIFLDFIKNKFVNALSKRDMLIVFKLLKNKIRAATSSDYFERIAFEYFDFISWLDAKIQGRSFEEIVRKKVNDVSE